MRLMLKEIVVNVEDGETRVAIVEDGVPVEVYVERPVSQRVSGNIYKGKVENVLPGMQAAFVDIGLERNSFLYVADAIPARGNGEDDEEFEDIKNLSIRDVLKVGQQIIAQVTKEPVGTKGARVTRHVTLPGRYLVLMPTVDYVGVSRRIGCEKERERLRLVAEKVKAPGVGVIVRTAAEGREDKDLEQDAEFLRRLWSRIQAKARRASAPSLLHKDLGLVYRVIRDVFTEEVEKLVVDSRQEYEKVLELLEVMSPELKRRVHLFKKGTGIFDVYGIEAEIDKALKRKVWLKCGGHIVIDQMEALTAIDVNTGKYVGSVNLADTVLKTNLDAAREIARQIRLRNIGGIIVIDFIDMERAEHREQVLRTLEDHLRRDRTKATILGLTKLGLVEMTRKKVWHGLEDMLQKQCPYCEGRGRVLSEETMARKAKREIRKALRHTAVEAMLVEAHPAVASMLIGPGGLYLRELEKETGRYIYVKGCADLGVEDVRIGVAGTRQEVETKALPTRVGEVIEVKVEEPHISNAWDGIARIGGYVIDIEGAGKLVGEKVKIEITKVFRTYARAKLVDPAQSGA